jgi:hypothetical protein
MAYPTTALAGTDNVGAEGLTKINTHFADSTQHVIYGRVSMGWADTLTNFTVAQPGAAPIGFSGTLLEVEVNLTTPGSTSTVFQVDKGPYVSDTAAPVYAAMLSSALTVSANTYRAAFDVSAQNITVAKLDLIRLPVPTSKGTGAAGFYVTTRWRITG